MPYYNPAARTTQKTPCYIKEAGLLIRCLVIDVLLLRALASWECFNRAVA
jgi:hypothetical protein